MNALRVGVLFVFIALVGCSSGGGSGFKADSFSEKDMCIVQTEGDAEICYGDKRADVEKILGVGEKGKFPATIAYENDVSVMYREDIVAGIAIREDNAGKFKTARGANIGMEKKEVKSLYGEKHAIDNAPHNLDYAYNSKEKKLVDQTAFSKVTAEDSQQYYLFSATFDEDGKATSLLLLDRKMAVYLM